MPHLPAVHFASILGFVLGILLLTRELKQRRAPSVTFAWILIIVLVPYVGVPLYLMFGGRKIRKRAESKQKLYGPALETRDDDTPIERLLSGMGVPKTTNDNAVELLPNGETAYAELMALIASAERSLHIATFVFGGDAVGDAILEALAARAKQGVEVRLLIDGVFAYKVNRALAQSLRDAGGRIAFFAPLIHIPFRTRTNLRLHRKLALADGSRAISGGMNLAQEYLGPVPLASRWRDMALRIEGSAVADFEHVFRADWEFTTGEKLAPLDSTALAATPRAKSPTAVRIVASGPDVATDTLYDVILSSIFAAQKRIWIATPYFVPDDPIVRALMLACRRGVEVRIIVPDPSNHLTADLAGASSLRDLEEQGASVRPYRLGMLHAKVTLFDDTMALVGSANLDMRSLFLNYEIDAVLYGSPEIAGVAAWFTDLTSVCATSLHPATRLRAVIEDVARLIGPLE